jgi:hypothetical protein
MLVDVCVCVCICSIVVLVLFWLILDLFIYCAQHIFCHYLELVSDSYYYWKGMSAYIHRKAMLVDDHT